MSRLIALHFDKSESAEEALARMRSASKSDNVVLYDALSISWPDGQRRPTTRRPIYLTIPGKSIETLQSLVLSLINVLITLGAGALSVVNHLLKSGINSDFITEVTEEITSGTSILVLMTDTESAEKLDALFADLEPRQVATNSFTLEEQ